ncbi:MAG: hypothetical protein AABW80_03870 [Nanoarchaeota archaeon]
MDYGFGEKRKGKNDKKAKARFNRYKKGGKHRVEKIEYCNSNKEN